jgi:hypothetical protein
LETFTTPGGTIELDLYTYNLPKLILFEIVRNFSAGRIPKKLQKNNRNNGFDIKFDLQARALNFTTI